MSVENGCSALLINTGTGRNLGDRAMMLNVLRLLSERKVSNVFIPFQFKSQLAKEYRTTTYTPLYSCFGRAPKLKGWLGKFFQLLDVTASVFITIILMVFVRLTSRNIKGDFGEAQLLNAINQSDMVILNGGGYLTDSGRLECRSCLWMAIIAIFLNKPVFMTGQGIGPISTRLTQWLLTRVAKNSTKILVRDPSESKDLLISYGVESSKIICAGDDALSLPLRSRPLKLDPDNGPILGLHFRISPFTPGAEDLVQILSDVALTMVNNGWQLRLFVFATQQGWEMEFYQSLCSKLPDSSFEIIVDDDPRQLSYALAQCSVAMGVAYHFLVFSLTQGIPSIGLYNGEYYRQKLGGLLQWFNNEQWLCRYDQTTASQLVSRLVEMSQDRYDDANSLKIRSNELKDQHHKIFNEVLLTDN